MILTQKFLIDKAIERKITSNVSLERLLEQSCETFSMQNVFDLFISHSFLDKNLIATLVSLFNELNYSVYVDWLNDLSLDRNKVSSKTASIIKTRIENCRGLAYVATNNIANSKWCPWELGLADGLHNGKSCILPIMKEANSFKGTEYLGLYPYIEYEKIKGKNSYDFWIVHQEDQQKYLPLRSWLDGKTL